MKTPLILVTNDDGIDSAGLWAVAEAVLHLGDVLVVAPDRDNGEGRPGYRLIENVKRAEPGSDIHTLLVDRMISVTPLSLDLTSRVSRDAGHRQLPETSLSCESPADLFTRSAHPSGLWREYGRSGLSTVTLDAKSSLAE